MARRTPYVFGLEISVYVNGRKNIQNTLYIDILISKLFQVDAWYIEYNFHPHNNHSENLDHLCLQ